MRSLSYWAKYHPAIARLIIVISRCLLFFIAWFLGEQLTIAAIDVSPLWLYFFLLLFFAACLLYPAKKSAATYVHRKMCDFIVCISGFFMMICVTAQLYQPTPLYQNVRATVPIENPAYKYPEAEKLLKQFQNREKTTFSRKEKRIIRKEFNYQLLRYGKATVTGNKEAQSNAALIILAIVAAVGLLYLVLALACTLSCNGSDAAALIVALLGTAAIIWGLTAIIRSIKRKKASAGTTPYR